MSEHEHQREIWVRLITSGQWHRGLVGSDRTLCGIGWNLVDWSIWEEASVPPRVCVSCGEIFDLGEPDPVRLVTPRDASAAVWLEWLISVHDNQSARIDEAIEAAREHWAGETQTDPPSSGLYQVAGALRSHGMEASGAGCLQVAQEVRWLENDYRQLVVIATAAFKVKNWEPLRCSLVFHGKRCRALDGR